MTSLAASLKTILLFTCLATAHADHSQFLKAIHLYNNGDKIASVNLLEKLISADLDKDTRKNTLFILAFSDNRILKKGKRHDYAKQLVAEFSASIDEAQKAPLYRILGDGFFEEGNLPEAKIWFEKLTYNIDEEQKDYGFFKLGWIDLNESHPDLAFSKWMGRLKTKRAQERSLYSSFLRDAGKAWAEGEPGAAYVVNSLKALSSFESESRELVSDGIISGLRRHQDFQSMKFFQKILLPTSLYTSVAQRALSQRLFAKDNPCFALDWLTNVSDLSEFSEFKLIPALQTCYISFESNPKTQWTSSNQSLVQLLSIFRKLPLQGKDRLIRISLSHRMGLLNATLAESISILNDSSLDEESKSKIEAEIPFLIKNIREKGLSMANIDLKPLVERITPYLKDKKKSELAMQIFSELTQIPSSLSLVENEVFSKPALFTDTLLPPLLFDRLNPKEQSDNSVFYLSNFLSGSLNPTSKDYATWKLALFQVNSKQLAEKTETKEPTVGTAPVPAAPSKYEAVFQRLVKLSPLNGPMPIDDKVSLWLPWALQNEETELFDTDDTGVKLFDLAEKSKFKKEDPSLIVALGLKLEDTSLIWKASKHIQFQKVSKDLKSRFFSLSLAQALSQELSLDLLHSSPEGKELALIAKTENPTPKQVKNLRDLLIPQDPNLKDVQFIIALMSVEPLFAKKLKFNSSLVKSIETRVNKIKREVEFIGSITWSNNHWATLAKKKISVHCDLFTRQLKKIRNIPGLDKESLAQWHTQLDEVLNTVQEWKTSLLQPQLAAEGI